MRVYFFNPKQRQRAGMGRRRRGLHGGKRRAVRRGIAAVRPVRLPPLHLPPRPARTDGARGECPPRTSRGSPGTSSAAGQPSACLVGRGCRVGQWPGQLVGCPACGVRRRTIRSGRRSGGLGRAEIRCRRTAVAAAASWSAEPTGDRRHAEDPLRWELTAAPMSGRGCQITARYLSGTPEMTRMVGYYGVLFGGVTNGKAPGRWSPPPGSCANRAPSRSRSRFPLRARKARGTWPRSSCTAPFRRSKDTRSATMSPESPDSTRSTWSGNQAQPDVHTLVQPIHSQAGGVGQSNEGSRNQPTPAGSACPNCGP